MFWKLMHIFAFYQNVSASSTEANALFQTAVSLKRLHRFARASAQGGHVEKAMGMNIFFVLTSSVFLYRGLFHVSTIDSQNL